MSLVCAKINYVIIIKKLTDINSSTANTWQHNLHLANIQLIGGNRNIIRHMPQASYSIFHIASRQKGDHWFADEVNPVNHGLIHNTHFSSLFY